MNFKNIFSIKITYRILFGISLGMVLWYVINLILSGYISFCKPFDLEISTKISPFMGSFVAPFIALAATLVTLENLIEFKNNNRETEKRQTIDLTLKHCQMFLVEIQLDSKIFAEKKIPCNAALNSSNYLTEPLTNSQIVNNPILNSINDSVTANHADIVLYLNKLNYLSSYFLLGNADLELGRQIIGKTFIEQVQYMLPYIAFYRTKDSLQFCDSIVELYKKWGGVIREIIERVE